MSKKFFKVSVFTPAKNWVYEECLSLSCKGVEGDFEILPGHENFISMLSNGEVAIKKASNEVKLFVSNNSLIKYEDDACSIIAESAIDQVDEGSAEQIEGIKELF